MKLTAKKMTQSNLVGQNYANRALHQSVSTIKKSHLKLSHLCILGALALSACATKPAVQAETPAPVVKTTVAEKTMIDEKPLTPRFITQYLTAEIAGQRGDFATSGSIFYQLASTQQDARFAERAAKTAAYGHVNSLIYPSVELWATLDPASVEAQQAISEILIKQNKLQDTEPHLARLLAKENTRARGFLFINNILSKSHDKNGALKLVQSLAAPYPNLPEAHFAVAQSAMAARNNPVALDALTQAEALNPGWNLAALLKGQILFAQSPQSAIDYYQQFTTDYPDKNEIRLNYAKMLVNQGEYKRAKEQFPIIIDYAKKAVTKAESDSILEANKKIAKQQSEKNLADITAVIGLLSFEGEDYPAANSYFQQALDLNYKDQDQIYLYFGQVASKQNKLAMARGWYEKITNGPHFLSAQINIAELIKTQESVDKAIEFLDDVDFLTGEQQVIAAQMQASMLNQAKRHEDAFKLLGKAVKNIPNTPTLMYDYGLAAERMKDFDLMEKQLRQAIKLKPDFAAAYNALGYSFADRNIKLNEAVELIEKALTLSPNDHYMLDSLGWAYYRKGDYNNAIKHLQTAYNMQADPEIAAHLGEVLWVKGDHEAAQKIWQEALAKNPDNALLQSTTKKFTS
jgi:tetratricopeptide (TPR) repeat protein